MTADLPADRRLWCTSVHPDDPDVHGGGWHQRFECPVCSRKSSHPEDIRDGYCVACHDTTGPGYLGYADPVDVAPTGRLDPWAAPFAVDNPPPPPTPAPVWPATARNDPPLTVRQILRRWRWPR